VSKKNKAKTLKKTSGKSGAAARSIVRKAVPLSDDEGDDDFVIAAPKKAAGGSSAKRAASGALSDDDLAQLGRPKSRSSSPAPPKKAKTLKQGTLSAFRRDAADDSIEAIELPAKPKAAPAAKARVASGSKAKPKVLVDSEDDSFMEEAAPPARAAPSARAGRSVKAAVKYVMSEDEDEEDGESVYGSD
jgi:hypothetical protein